MSSASMAMVPLLLPAEVGLKVTVMVFEPPTATVVELGLTEYCPEPVPMEMFVTTSGADPGLLIEKVSVLVFPTETLPKAMLEGEISI